jgi:hypothetical protein
MPTPAGSIAALASSPLLTQYAITKSQSAIRKIGSFIAPIVEVPTLTFRYRVYSDQQRYRIAASQRNPGDKATRLGFTSTDKYEGIVPQALDFPIPNTEGLSKEELQWSIMEAQGILADESALTLEYQQVTGALAALNPNAFSWSIANAGANDPIADPTYGLDAIIKKVKLAVGNGASIKVLFGTSAFLAFRNHPSVLKRYIVNVGGGSKNASAVGTQSPAIEDIGAMLFTTPKVAMSEMVVDLTAPGVASNPTFILDNNVLVFASNDTPNRMDPSFMKTFATMGGFFRPGTYQSEDNRDQILKMDWNTLPLVTNASAGYLLATT